MINHDKLFKELLTTFFVEFIELFVPGVVPYLDKTSIMFLDKELFAGEKRREADIVVRARFKGKDTFFLIHTEAQAQHQAEFPGRLFRYFAVLHEKFELPVYPIALLSYKSPRKKQRSYYSVRFPDREVLRFDYALVQLNRLSWRRYATQANPVAAALMAKMNIAPGARARVKLECLRLLVTLKLDSAKQRMISEFIDAYLDLTAEEMKQYVRARAKLREPEQEAIMERETSWSREGRRLGLEEGLEKGRQEGMLLLVSKLLSRRFGAVDDLMLERLKNLATEELEAFSGELLDFRDVADLEQWLKSRGH
jgi:hypothetical protein